MEQILLVYETFTAIMMFFKDTRAMVRSPDGDPGFFDIVTGILQENTLVQFLFLICQDYVLQTSIDANERK